jgi:hypothetical protein
MGGHCRWRVWSELRAGMFGIIHADTPVLYNVFLDFHLSQPVLMTDRVVGVVLRSCHPSTQMAPPCLDSTPCGMRCIQL